MNPARRRRAKRRARARKPLPTIYLHHLMHLSCGCVFTVASKAVIRGCVRILVKYMRGTRCEPGCTTRVFGGAVTLEEDDWTFEVTVEGVAAERVIDRATPLFNRRSARSRLARPILPRSTITPGPTLQSTA